MLNTAKEYTSLIRGQNPEEEKHSIFLEIEPVIINFYLIN